MVSFPEISQLGVWTITGIKCRLKYRVRPRGRGGGNSSLSLSFFISFSFSFAFLFPSFSVSLLFPSSYGYFLITLYVTVLLHLLLLVALNFCLLLFLAFFTLLCPSLLSSSFFSYFLLLPLYVFFLPYSWLLYLLFLCDSSCFIFEVFFSLLYKQISFLFLIISCWLFIFSFIRFFALVF